MKILRAPDGSVTFAELEPILMDLLRGVPDAADPGESTAAQERLLPDPAPDDPELGEEWREFVCPDLRHIFQTAQETLAGDVKEATVEEETASVRVPVAHFEAWLNALNQARLALHARHGFADEEMEGMEADTDTERNLAMFQIHFYGVLQEFLLRGEEAD